MGCTRSWGARALALLVGALAVWRIGRVVSLRALAMTARATGSFGECVAFIRFCAEEESDVRETRQLKQPRESRRGPG